MDEFARRSTRDRRAFIEEAASRRDLTPIIIEKVFWVCWTLRRLTAATALRDHVTFKGGTVRRQNIWRNSRRRLAELSASSEG